MWLSIWREIGEPRFCRSAEAVFESGSAATFLPDSPHRILYDHSRWNVTNKKRNKPCGFRTASTWNRILTQQIMSYEYCSWLLLGSPDAFLSFFRFYPYSVSDKHESKQNEAKQKNSLQIIDGISWWRHQMGTFSALLAFCAGNSSVPGEFPAQRSVTRSLDVFFDLHPNKRLSKQSWGWWFETPSSLLWRHCNVLQKWHAQ